VDMKVYIFSVIWVCSNLILCHYNVLFFKGFSMQLSVLKVTFPLRYDHFSTAYFYANTNYNGNIHA
jgi:hypothetical protein